MKRVGSGTTAAEQRAERAIVSFAMIDAAKASYETAVFPVASPSYYAVESTSFDVSVGGNDAGYFLRLANDEIAELVDDEVALAAASRLYGLGLSPEPVAHAPAERATLFTRLGEGWRTAKIDDLMQDHVRDRLVAVQKMIAAGKPFERPWSVFDGIAQLRSLLSEAGVACPRDTDWMLAWMSSIHAAIAAAGVDMKPAHGDPHSSNVMLGPGNAIMLVDFDMAADLDPYYQLGVLMNELFQFENQMKPLLEMYDGRFTERHFSRCRLYAAADDLYWALRSLLQDAHSTHRGVEFLKYAEWRFLRCRMLLGHPDFEQRLRSL